MRGTLGRGAGKVRAGDGEMCGRGWQEGYRSGSSAVLGSAQLGRSARLDSARPKRGRGEGRGRQRRGGQRGPTQMGTQLRSAPLLRCPEIPALVPRPSRGSRSVCPGSPLSWQGGRTSSGG